MKAEKKLPPGSYKGIFSANPSTQFVYGNTPFFELDKVGNPIQYESWNKYQIITPIENVKTIAQIDPDIWVGSPAGAFRLDRTRKKAEILTFGRTIEIMADTAPEKVWLGNQHGLLYYTPETGVEQYKDKAGNRFNYMAHAMAQTSDGTLYLGTHGKGLWRIQNNSLERIDKALHIQAHLYRELLCDGPYLWCSTNTGLYKIDSRQHKAHKVQIGGSMPSEELFGMALDDSLLWVSTSYGVTYFPKDIPTISDESPPIYLEHFQGSNKKGEIVYDRILPPGFDQIEIEFSSVSFSEKLSYEFRVGTDGYWQPLATPSLRFSSINPGSHLYQIRAVRANGVSSDNPLNVQFELRPPFWQNLWFLVLLIGFLAFVAFLWIRKYLMDRIKRTELQAAMESEIERSRLAALRAQMNPHFTFNVLNAIQEFLLRGDTEKAHAYLADFAKLLRASLDLADKDFSPLFHEIGFLQTYLRLEQLRFEDRITISWDIDESVNNSFAYIPNMIIQPLIENAILHGLGNLQDKGQLFIRVDSTNEMVRFFIMDNGIGILQAQLDKSMEPTTHISKGMLLLKQRLNWMYEARPHKAQISWHDLSSHQHTHNFLPEFGQGTLVTVIFPVS